MLLIRIIVPKDPEFYDECEEFVLIQYTQDTEERHTFAANQIAAHFERYNVRFSRDKAIPFNVEVLYFPLLQALEYGNIVEMLAMTDAAIRKGLEPQIDIKRMRELLALHDKFSKMAQVLREKTVEIKHYITTLLVNHTELYL